MTTDPIVSAPISGQAWNAYSYVVNNPLNHVDPSGFEDTPPPEQPIPNGVYIPVGKGVEACIGCPLPPKTVEGPREAVQNGATTRPVDVSTTGTSAGYVPQPVTTAPKSTPAGRVLGVGTAALTAVGGAAFGFGTGVGTAYALGVLTGVCPVCGAVAGAGLLGYGIYQLATGGAQELIESGQRISGGEGTAGDYFAVGSVVGRIASGGVAKGAFGAGIAHGQAYGTAPMWLFVGAGGPGGAARGAAARGAEAATAAGKLPWGFFSDYPKVVQNGTEYAQIGERLFTEHAVERMLPVGMGGRGIAPGLVEDAIRTGVQSTQVVNGVTRTSFTSGNIQVVTEQGAKLVVTVMRIGGQ